MGERKILLAGGAILVLGIAKSAQTQQPLDRPIVGGLALMLLLAFLAIFGPATAALAGDFAMLALLAVSIAEAGPLLGAISTI